jgi:hypothetical protein
MILLRTLAAATLLGLVALPDLSVRAQLPGQTAPGNEARVTTDTPEYCESLAERVHRAEVARPNAMKQADELAEEGHHMCATGLIHGGLQRLRRAWLMLRRDK